MWSPVIGVRVATPSPSVCGAVTTFGYRTTFIAATCLAVSVCGLAGCTSWNKSAAEIEVIDGCLFRVRGISGSEANNIAKTWDFNTNCEVEVRSRARKTAPKDEMSMDSADHNKDDGTDQE